MYAQITVTASYDAVALRQALFAQIGCMWTAPAAALKGTVLASSAEAVAPTVIAAQSIRNAVIILYFFDGPDTISIHITATTLAELKSQIRRATRQLLAELGDGGAIITAEIFSEATQGIDSSIARGVRVSLSRQLAGNAAERWISKLLAPAIIFALASSLLAGTAAAVSALIGLVAAFVVFLVELALLAYHGNEWLWEVAG